VLTSLGSMIGDTRRKALPTAHSYEKVAPKEVNRGLTGAGSLSRVRRERERHVGPALRAKARCTR